MIDLPYGTRSSSSTVALEPSRISSIRQPVGGQGLPFLARKNPLALVAWPGTRGCGCGWGLRPAERFQALVVLLNAESCRCWLELRQLPRF